jgi:hypothetical protein
MYLSPRVPHPYPPTAPNLKYTHKVWGGLLKSRELCRQTGLSVPSAGGLVRASLLCAHLRNFRPETEYASIQRPERTFEKPWVALGLFGIVPHSVVCFLAAVCSMCPG